MSETALVEQQPWWLAGWSKHVSPSALGRVAACPRSEAMPHSYEESEYASKGTIAHKFLADCQNHGREKALGMVEDAADIEWLQLIDLERLPAFHQEAYAAEAAIAYNPRTRTARIIGYNLSRAEARAKAEDHEIVGIVDVLGESEDEAVVHDYKTGHGYVEPAATNMQLKTYALFAARAMGKSRAKYSIIRAKDNGSTWFDAAEMDELDLIAHEEALLSLLAFRLEVRDSVRLGEWKHIPALVEGRHCRYCPAYAFCPAKTAGVKSLVAQDETSGPPSGVLQPEQAAEAWRRVRAAQKTLERWEAILRDYARQTPIPLGDGEVLGEKQVTTESILPEKAREPMERRYGPVGGAAVSQSTVIEASITKAAFRKALHKLVLPTLPPDAQKITWLEREAMKVLREGGAVTTSVRRSVCEHTPPKQLLPEGEAQAEETEAA